MARQAALVAGELFGADVIVIDAGGVKHLLHGAHQLGRAGHVINWTVQAAEMIGKQLGRDGPSFSRPGLSSGVQVMVSTSVKLGFEPRRAISSARKAASAGRWFEKKRVTLRCGSHVLRALAPDNHTAKGRNANAASQEDDRT